MVARTQTARSLLSRSTLVVVAVLYASATWSQPRKVDELVDRATLYVQAFVDRFSNVVAEEHYLQKSEAPPQTIGQGSSRSVVQPPAEHIELKSDFLLVRTGNGNEWAAFRDVFSVNGRNVRDREERLSKLFIESPASAALDQARRIASESARYNLGDPLRSINNPVVALAFLQFQYRDRFAFEIRQFDRRVGPNVRVVEYREDARPTIIRAANDRDAPASGRLWIEADTGRVLKTELVVMGADRVTTTFAFDNQFQIAVPVEMTDSFAVRRTAFRGVATYGRFRRFGVQTEEAIK